jgi:DNA invertase Pin-like site-specific DNA recombinase
MNYVGYLRRSTAGQDLTFDAQRDAIEAAARANGWTIGAWESDTLSGRRLQRGGIESALDRCVSGTADGIVVSKLDRLTRSVVDLGGLLELAKKHGFAVVALDFGVDTSTPQGELVANLLVSVAQWERRIIGQRISDALQTLPRDRRNGRPCYPDEVRARARELRAAGMTLHAISMQLGREGVTAARSGQRHVPLSAINRMCRETA